MPLGARFPEILAAARTGAPWALEAIYREFHPPVLGFLRARAPGDAEDLASDVFIAAAEGLPRFSGDEEGFRSWLFTITYRKVGDSTRFWREDLDAVLVVEVAGHVAGHFQVLHLVLAHRHDVRAVDEDVGGHQGRVGEQADGAPTPPRPRTWVPACPRATPNGTRWPPWEPRRPST